jgi:hypothetical protein
MIDDSNRCSLTADGRIGRGTRTSRRNPPKLRNDCRAHPSWIAPKGSGRRPTPLPNVYHLAGRQLPPTAGAATDQGGDVRRVYVAAERNGPDVFADERLPFAALAEADLEPTKRALALLLRFCSARGPML